MAEWKKIIVSGSDAKLNSLIVDTFVTSNTINTGVVTASNEMPLLLPNLSLKPRHFVPIVYDADSGKVSKGAPYSPAVGPGSPTVGVSGSLPNNIVVIGSGSGFVQTASGIANPRQDVNFNSAHLFGVNEISASGNISSSGFLLVNTTEEEGQDNYRVLLKDLTTGRIYHTSSYSRGVTRYFQLLDIPAGIVSSSLQFTNTDDVEFRNITASSISASEKLIANLTKDNSSVYNPVLYNSESGQFFFEDVSNNDASGIGFPYAGSDTLTADPRVQAVITGSLLLSGSGHITASGNISSSGIIKAKQLELKSDSSTNEITFFTTNDANIKSFGDLKILTGVDKSIRLGSNDTEDQVYLTKGHITASGNISSSGTITAQNLNIENNITASSISASNKIITNEFTASGNVQIGGDLNIDGAISQEGFSFVEDNIVVITGSNNFGSTASVNLHTFTGSIVISSSQASAFTVLNDTTTTVTISPAGKITAVEANIPDITATSIITNNITASSDISSSGELYVSKINVFGPPGDSGQIYINDHDDGLDVTNGLFLNKSGDSAFIYNRDSGQLELGTNDIRQFHIKDSATLDGLLKIDHDGINISGSITASGNISSSGDLIINQITASSISASPNVITHHITASGNITASQFLGTFVGTVTGEATGLTGTPDITVGSIISTTISASNITASNISASGFISASNFIGIFHNVISSSLQFTNTDDVEFRNITASIVSASFFEGIFKDVISSSLQFTSTDDVTFRNITASGHISSSGKLFASLSLQPNSPNLNTVLYDSESGEFFFTGSQGGTGAGFPFEGIAQITGSLIVSGNHTDITRIDTPVNMTNNVVIGGNLTVQGDTTTMNVTNLEVEDRFIIIGSGSSALDDQDVGILFDVETVDGTGSVFFFDNDEDRFAVGKNVMKDLGLNNSIGGGGIGAGSHAGFVVTTTISENNVNPNTEVGSAQFGLGELRILKNGDIYIFTTSSNT